MGQEATGIGGWALGPQGSHKAWACEREAEVLRMDRDIEKQIFLTIEGFRDSSDMEDVASQPGARRCHPMKINPVSEGTMCSWTVRSW